MTSKSVCHIGYTFHMFVIPVCHPFQSHLIINIMAADVYMHTNEQQINNQIHTHTHLFKTKSCRSWHNFHFRQVIATQYFQIKTYCIKCKNVFDYECSQIFGMSCYIHTDLLHYCRTIQTFFRFLSFFPFSVHIKMFMMYYVHILSTNFILLLTVMFFLTQFQELCEETTLSIQAGTFYYFFLLFISTLNGFCLIWLTFILGLTVFSRTWESLQKGRVLSNQCSTLVMFYCITVSMKKGKNK